MKFISGYGGIGRHAGLRILWGLLRAGSSPANRTNFFYANYADMVELVDTQD